MTKIRPNALGIILSAVLTSAFIVVLMPRYGLATTFEKIEVECPIDGKKIEKLVLMSFYVDDERLDMRPFGSGFRSPWPLPVCLESGFVIYKESFTPDELSKIKSIVQSDEYKKIRRQNSDYYVVAYVAEQLGASDEFLAWKYLEASWQVERRDPDLNGELLSLSLERFKRFLAGKTLEVETLHNAFFVAANLERRLGNFAKAEKLLSEFRTAQNLDAGWDVYVEALSYYINEKDRRPHRISERRPALFPCTSMGIEKDNSDLEPELHTENFHEAFRRLFIDISYPEPELDIKAFFSIIRRLLNVLEDSTMPPDLEWRKSPGCFVRNLKYMHDNPLFSKPNRNSHARLIYSIAQNDLKKAIEYSKKFEMLEMTEMLEKIEMLNKIEVLEKMKAMEEEMLAMRGKLLDFYHDFTSDKGLMSNMDSMLKPNTAQ